MPERRVDDYSWAHDTEPKANLDRPPMAFDVVAIRDTPDNLYRLAFECYVIGPEVLGPFSIVDPSEAGVATVTTQPVPKSTPGLVTIDFSKITRSDKNATFFLGYLPEGADKPKKLYQITVKPDRDWMGASMVGGPFERSKGQWTDAT